MKRNLGNQYNQQQKLPITIKDHLKFNKSGLVHVLFLRQNTYVHLTAKFEIFFTMDYLESHAQRFPKLLTKNECNITFPLL